MTTAMCEYLEDMGMSPANATRYTSLLVDQRGIGGSESPWAFPTMETLAKDVVEVLDHLGWTDDRSIHVVGHSMGGMAAEELLMFSLPKYRFVQNIDLRLSRLCFLPLGLHR